MKRYIIGAVCALVAAAATAQEYHGEMERLYPEKAKTAKTVKQTTAKTTTEAPTTLLPELQQLATELLKGRKGSVVAIRPSTGEIICMATNSPEGANNDLAIATA